MEEVIYQINGLVALSALTLAVVFGALVSSLVWSYTAPPTRLSSRSRQEAPNEVPDIKKVAQTDTSAVSLMQCVKRADPYDPSPRTDYLSWDDYFMAVAFLSAGRSKDPNKQVNMLIKLHPHPPLTSVCGDHMSHTQDSMEHTQQYAVTQHHPSMTQVGACIVNDDNIILSIGYNGFPRGCSDSQLPWARKSQNGNILGTKYPYVSRCQAARWHQQKC
jgi:dCMP deaminase